jgi:hypothetical protein
VPSAGQGGTDWLAVRDAILGHPKLRPLEETVIKQQVSADYRAILLLVTDHATTAGLALYSLDLWSRKAAGLFENRLTGRGTPEAVKTVEGGLTVVATRNGSLEFLLRDYGSVEAWFSAHPFAFATLIGGLGLGKKAVISRTRRSRDQAVDRAGFPIVKDDVERGVTAEIDLPIATTEGQHEPSQLARDAVHMVQGAIGSRELSSRPPKGIQFIQRVGDSELTTTITF